MKITTKRSIQVVLVLAVLVWAVLWYLRKTVPPTMTFSDTELFTVDGHQKISVRDFTGKVVIVSCFQTWCRDCARETPILNQLAGNLHSENFRVIYITDEANTKLGSFRSRLASGNILFTTSGKSLADLGIHVYPTSFLLNKKGEVVLAKLEGHDWLREETLIRKLLAE